MHDSEKIKIYRAYLKRPYWELQEATSLVRGVTEFGGKILLHKQITTAYGSKSYNFGPMLNDQPIAIDEEFLTTIVATIQKKVLRANIISHPEHFEFDKRFVLQKHTYLIEPYEFLAYVVTEGSLLPAALQIASGLHQAHKPTKAKKNGWINEAKREAFAQACWHKNPNDNCNELTRKTLKFNKYIYSEIAIIQKKIKKEPQDYWRLSKLRELEFLYDSEKRTWDITNSVKPPGRLHDKSIDN